MSYAVPITLLRTSDSRTLYSTLPAELDATLHTFTPHAPRSVFPLCPSLITYCTYYTALITCYHLLALRLLLSQTRTRLLAVCLDLARRS
jgi:hypothetical protein